MILRRLNLNVIKNTGFAYYSQQKPKKPPVYAPILNGISWILDMYKPPDLKPPYNHCVQIGDPILRLKAQDVPLEKIKSDEIQNVIKQMKKVHRDYNLVGIAAPQIGVSYRIIIIEFREDLVEKYPSDVYRNRQMETLPMTIIINPVINVENFNQVKFPEGCASVCGYTGEVGRYQEVLLSGLNENGVPMKVHLKGWNARIAQHEIDHLNGQVFVDIMEKKSFSCVTWAAVNRNGGQLSIPFYPSKSLLKKKLIT